MSDSFLQARELRKRYGSTVALDGVSLSIARGEMLGLLGPNGAGKTTLLSILAGLLDADAGEVRLDSHVFRRQDLRLRRRIGIGTQDLAVYPELTARENLLFFGRLYEIEAVKLRRRVDDLLAAVGLTERAESRVGTFSGGMKRRLNLAVAVVHEPEILFLDEPTTGVDPQSRHHIFELVRSLNIAGTTIVYTSHYIEEVQALCPRIAIIDNGKLKACDTLDALLRGLDATLTLNEIATSSRVIDAFRSLPGVRNVVLENHSLTLAAANLGPLLPRVAEVCREYDLVPASMTAIEPTLERVFLNLTGQALRD